MAVADLIHRHPCTLKGHQVRRLASHPPARVSGVHGRRPRDRGSQLRISCPHAALSPPQGVLGQRPLRDPHPQQLPQDGWHLAQRHADSIMQHVPLCHDPGRHPMGAGPILVGREVRMLPPHTVATGRAAAHRYPKLPYARSDCLRQVGDRRQFRPLCRQPPPANWAGSEQHGHLYRGLGERLGAGGCAVSERPLPGLAPRLFGGGDPRALGERRGLARALALEPRHFRLQRFHLRRQLGNLLLLLGDHSQRLIATQPCEVLRPRHGRQCRSLGGRLQAEPLINYVTT